MKQEKQAQDKDENDLVMPLRAQNPVLSFIVRNKEVRHLYGPTIICLLIAMVTFLGLGIAMLVSMGKAQVITIPYFDDQIGNCNEPGSICSITFHIDQPLEAPVYLSYQLDDYYQNQRIFIQSKSNSQLAGTVLQTSKEAKTCHPFITNEQMGVTQSWKGVPLDPKAVASPCGSFAKAFYNDDFALSYNSTSIPIRETGITWPGDQGGMFKRPSNSNDTQWIDPQNEHFIVWMRPAGLFDFKKLWGVINQDLVNGQYKMTIANNYQITGWDGAKYFVLSTIGTFGGQNYTLPILMIIVANACLIGVIYISRWAFRYHKVANYQ